MMEEFSSEDIRKLEADGSDAARIILMMVYTGMRVGELFSLPLEDYHKTYVVCNSKKTGQSRKIPICPDAQEHFRYFADRAAGPLLLSGYAWGTDFHRDYYALLGRLGIEKKTIHAARDTYIRRARIDGIPQANFFQAIGYEYCKGNKKSVPGI